MTPNLPTSHKVFQAFALKELFDNPNGDFTDVFALVHHKAVFYATTIRCSYKTTQPSELGTFEYCTILDDESYIQD